MGANNLPDKDQVNLLQFLHNPTVLKLLGIPSEV